MKLKYRLLHYLHFGVCFVPLAWIPCLLVLGYHIAGQFGHWPRPMIDDALYRTELFIVLRKGTNLLFLAGLASVPVYCALFHVMCDRYSRGQKRLLSLLYIGAWILNFIYMGIDPHKLLEWYISWGGTYGACNPHG